MPISGCAGIVPIPFLSAEAVLSPTPVLPVPLVQALAFRLERQHLTRPADGPLTAAASLLGAQAQVHSAALLQLRARTAAHDDPDLRRALAAERTLVKLWAQRSTLHLTPTADLGLILALRRLQVGAYGRWYAREGLSPQQVERLVAAIAAALAEHGPHSRMDLSRRLVPVLGDWARPWLEHSWGGVIKLACALGHVCHSPRGMAAAADTGMPDAGDAEREALFVHLPGWVAVPPVPEPRAAMAGLLRRYLAVYGPATPADFRKFTGIPAEPVRQAFGDLAPELLPVAMEGGRPAWILAADEAALRQAAPEEGQITVLPLFDPWLLAHADTGQYLEDRFRPAVYRPAGWISAVVLRQGRVVATWTHRRTARGWVVTLTPLTRVWRKEHPALRRALRHLAGGSPVEMVAAG